MIAVKPHNKDSAPLIGRNPRMRRVFRQIDKVAQLDNIAVLLNGESGTGKDVLAREIHRRSERADGPFIAVHTGAMPKELIASELFGHERGAFTGAADKKIGKFEAAHGGTLFLDEISTMDMNTQVHLLRVLEQNTIQRVGGNREIEVDARIVAATNQDLREMTETGTFREDLYYRLNVFRIDLPPLRKRGNDLRLLTVEFLKRYGEEFGKSGLDISPEAFEELQTYHWPGNVRELEHAIMKTVIETESAMITPEDLPEEIRSFTSARRQIKLDVGTTLEDAERKLIAKTLESVGGNKREAAAILGISRKSLYNKLHKYGIPM